MAQKIIVGQGEVIEENGFSDPQKPKTQKIDQKVRY